MLLVSLVVLFFVAFLLLRVFGAGADDEAPGADTTTTTAPGEGNDVGSETTLPSDGATTTTEASALPPLQEVRLDQIYDGLRQPSAIAAPKGDDRLFVAERFGVIRVFDENRTLLDTAFLDLTDQVLAGGIEQGMLGLDFHPDYEENGRFFVYYTDKGGNRQLSEFRVSADDPNVADADTEKVIFEYPQPPNATDIRHYGGDVVFGPDGYLWVSLGDGADSRAQGQDPNTPYATLFRIDVDGGDPYSIPPDNPFIDGGGMGEVWAYGLRNPWRIAVDPVDRLVYIADVGHADVEEVNVVPIDEGGGYNFGWSDVEGDRCFHVVPCDLDNYDQPALTYTHEEGLSITGGLVYRGSEIPEIDGLYFYSDWVRQWIRSFRFVDGEVTEEKDWTAELGEVGQINTFGFDGHGEMYLGTFEGGIFRFTPVR